MPSGHARVLLAATDGGGLSVTADALSPVEPKSATRAFGAGAVAANGCGSETRSAGACRTTDGAADAAARERIFASTAADLSSAQGARLSAIDAALPTRSFGSRVRARCTAAARPSGSPARRDWMAGASVMNS